MSLHNKDSYNVSRVLLLVFGILFILAALIYNEFLLVLFDADPPIDVGTLTRIRYVQIIFLITGLGLIFVSECVIKRVGWLDSITRKGWVVNILLAVLPLLTLIAILELSLQPFAETPKELTTIFMRDNELGWKLRPGSKDEWGGASITINKKGLRGPELSYTKPPDVKRILFLGDSVTFGYKLKSYQQTFPYLIENILRSKSDYEVEAINSGVDGYSPWQEYIYLTNEGIKYQPDLIVVSFVLNDVSEKLGLVMFGGTGEGLQLKHTVSKKFEKLIEKSSIVHFSRKIAKRIRFGSDIQEGAKQREVADVKDLVYHPDRPGVQKAWETTLQNLGKIFDYAKSRHIPVMLVVFPFTFQFDDINALSAPQKTVSEYAQRNNVPVIDLLPLLFEQMEENGTTPNDLFLDKDHLSPVGSGVVAEILANFIEQERLITDERGK